MEIRDYVLRDFFKNPSCHRILPNNCTCTSDLNVVLIDLGTQSVCVTLMINLGTPSDNERSGTELPWEWDLSGALIPSIIWGNASM